MIDRPKIEDCVVDYHKGYDTFEWHSCCRVGTGAFCEVERFLRLVLQHETPAIDYCVLFNPVPGFDTHVPTFSLYVPWETAPPVSRLWEVFCFGLIGIDIPREDQIDQMRECPPELRERFVGVDWSSVGVFEE